MIPIIKTTAATENGLAAIRKAIESGNVPQLFATDIMLNIKEERYFPAAPAGVCTPIAYDNKGTANAFYEILTRTATAGQDLDYQPRLKMSEPCTALLFTHGNAAPADDANTIIKAIPEAMLFDELLCTVHAAIDETGAQLVIIDDVAGYVKECGRTMLCSLNELANCCSVILLAGFMLTDEAEDISRCLVPYTPQLWQLTTHSLIMNNDDGESSREQPYFCLNYGGIDPKRIIYGIGNDGHACMVRDLFRLFRIKELAERLAPQWVSKSKFVNMCHGATKGEFEPQTIEAAIQTAVHNDIIREAGIRKKARVCYNGEKMSRAVIGKNIALSAFGNHYTSPKHTKKRKPILRHGEFRLIAPENCTGRATMQDFAIEMMKAVVAGQKWLEFKVETPYINTLAIIVGGDDTAAERLTERVAAGKRVKFSATVLPENITDEAFLTAYKQAIDTEKPNFVFILCYDRIQPQRYTEEQLAKELAIHSKRKAICTIAESDIEKVTLDLKDEYWSISQLVSDSDRATIDENFGVLLPCIYSFQGSVGDFDILCRFERPRAGEFHIASSNEQKRAFLYGTFYYARNNRATDMFDCTGRDLTENVIRQAQKAGLIKVHPYGKSLLESRITFIGEK